MSHKFGQKCSRLPAGRGSVQTADRIEPRASASGVELFDELPGHDTSADVSDKVFARAAIVIHDVLHVSVTGVLPSPYCYANLFLELRNPGVAQFERRHLGTLNLNHVL